MGIPFRKDHNSTFEGQLLEALFHSPSPGNKPSVRELPGYAQDPLLPVG
jgi:hypothetical protein